MMRAKVFPTCGQVIIVDGDPNDILNNCGGRKIIGAGHVGSKTRLVLADERANVKPDMRDIMNWAVEEVHAHKSIVHPGGGFQLRG